MRRQKSADLPPQEIAAALAPFEVNVTEEQLLKIRKYIGLLLFWNEKLSLTTVTDPAEIVSRHFGESIFVGSLTDLSYGRLADLGTGAGFPGLALKIVFPELKVALIESNSKKMAFLHEVAGQLALQGVEFLRSRYEDVSTADRKVDFVGSRALGDYKNLLNWSKEALRPGGKAIFWLGEEESVKVGKIGGWHWEMPKLIPESKKRVILMGKRAETAQYD